MAQEDLSKLKLNRNNENIKQPRKKKALVIFLTIAVGFFSVFFYFYSSPVNVTTTTVNLTFPAQSLTVLNASGYVVAQRKAALASKTTGRLIWLGVEEGDYVKKEQVVAKLENEDVIASKSQAEANVNVAKSNIESAQAELDDAKVNLERQKVLFDRGFATQSELDIATLRYKRAVASLENAKASLNAALATLRSTEVALEYTLIRAPFDGVVLTKNADIGDIITPLGAAANAKAAVVTIADLSSLLVEVDVSEANIGSVKVGQPCVIQLDAIPQKRFRGQVHMIVPTADRTKASIMIKVKFLEKYADILPEMSAKVSFLARKPSLKEEEQRLMVKRSAIIEKDGKSFAFLVKDDRAILTEVKVGNTFGEDVEVLSGLNALDKVVLSPSKGLKHNSKIKIEAK